MKILNIGIFGLLLIILVLIIVFIVCNVFDKIYTNNAIKSNFLNSKNDVKRDKKYYGGGANIFEDIDEQCAILTINKNKSDSTHSTYDKFHSKNHNIKNISDVLINNTNELKYLLKDVLDEYTYHIQSYSALDDMLESCSNYEDFINLGFKLKLSENNYNRCKDLKNNIYKKPPRQLKLTFLINGIHNYLETNYFNSLILTQDNLYDAIMKYNSNYNFKLKILNKFNYKKNLFSNKFYMIQILNNIYKNILALLPLPTEDQIKDSITGVIINERDNILLSPLPQVIKNIKIQILKDTLAIFYPDDLNNIKISSTSSTHSRTSISSRTSTSSKHSTSSTSPRGSNSLDIQIITFIPFDYTKLTPENIEKEIKSLITDYINILNELNEIKYNTTFKRVNKGIKIDKNKDISEFNDLYLMVTKKYLIDGLLVTEDSIITKYYTIILDYKEFIKFPMDDTYMDNLYDTYIKPKLNIINKTDVDNFNNQILDIADNINNYINLKNKVRFYIRPNGTMGQSSDYIYDGRGKKIINKSNLNFIYEDLWENKLNLALKSFNDNYKKINDLMGKIDAFLKSDAKYIDPSNEKYSFNTIFKEIQTKWNSTDRNAFSNYNDLHLILTNIDTVQTTYSNSIIDLMSKIDTFLQSNVPKYSNLSNDKYYFYTLFQVIKTINIVMNNIDAVDNYKQLKLLLTIIDLIQSNLSHEIIEYNNIINESTNKKNIIEYLYCFEYIKKCINGIIDNIDGIKNDIGGIKSIDIKNIKINIQEIIDFFNNDYTEIGGTLYTGMEYIKKILTDIEIKTHKGSNYIVPKQLNLISPMINNNSTNNLIVLKNWYITNIYIYIQYNIGFFVKKDKKDKKDPIDLINTNVEIFLSSKAYTNIKGGVKGAYASIKTLFDKHINTQSSTSIFNKDSTEYYKKLNDFITEVNKISTTTPTPKSGGTEVIDKYLGFNYKSPTDYNQLIYFLNKIDNSLRGDYDFLGLYFAQLVEIFREDNPSLIPEKWEWEDRRNKNKKQPVEWSNIPFFKQKTWSDPIKETQASTIYWRIKDSVGKKEIVIIERDDSIYKKDKNKIYYKPLTPDEKKMLKKRIYSENRDLIDETYEIDEIIDGINSVNPVSGRYYIYQNGAWTNYLLPME